MDSKGLTALEMDAIGEVLNISLGSSATALSTMLNARVEITTPVVKVVTDEEFEFSNLEPAIGVEITYIDGLSGNNIMLLKRADVKTIVEILMSMEIPDEEFQLDEMNISAICEVMNQMMGASSTALSEFLGKVVNISTPISFEIHSEAEFKEKYFSSQDPMAVVSFTLKIDGKLESEFMNVMPMDLARSLVAVFLPEGMEGALTEQESMPAVLEQTPVEEASSGGMMSQEEIEKLLSAASAPDPEPVTSAMVQEPAIQMPPVGQPLDASEGLLQQQLLQQQTMMNQMMQQMQMMQQQIASAPAKKVDPKTIQVQPMIHQSMPNKVSVGEEQEENLELIMGVPLEVTVEIGRTKRLVKDILEYTKGSLVVLDKLAGDQVDLLVNGQCIAKGDVVVVDDNFGIRITEIIKKPEFS